MLNLTERTSPPLPRERAASTFCSCCSVREPISFSSSSREILPIRCVRVAVSVTLMSASGNAEAVVVCLVLVLQLVEASFGCSSRFWPVVVVFGTRVATVLVLVVFVATAFFFRSSFSFSSLTAAADSALEASCVEAALVALVVCFGPPSPPLSLFPPRETRLGWFSTPTSAVRVDLVL